MWPLIRSLYRPQTQWKYWVLLLTIGELLAATSQGRKVTECTSHYSDVIMGARASQITGVSIVYSTVCSGADSKKTPKLCVTGLCEGNSPMTGESPAQRASNAEKVSIWWRHHGWLKGSLDQDSRTRSDYNRIPLVLMFTVKTSLSQLEKYKKERALRFVLADYRSGFTDLLQTANGPGIKTVVLQYGKWSLQMR